MAIVQATHHILREHESGDRLPYGDLSLFLEVCNNNILSNDIGEEVMAQEVQRALEMVAIFGKYKTR